MCISACRELLCRCVFVCMCVCICVRLHLKQHQAIMFVVVNRPAVQHLSHFDSCAVQQVKNILKISQF